MSRRLYKDSKNGQISGVCAGLSDYLNLDVSIVRILMIVIAFFTGVGIIPYIVLMIVLPEKPVQTERHERYEGTDDYEDGEVYEERNNEDEDLYSYNEDDYDF